MHLNLFFSERRECTTTEQHHGRNACYSVKKFALDNFNKHSQYAETLRASCIHSLQLPCCSNPCVTRVLLQRWYVFYISPLFLFLACSTQCVQMLCVVKSIRVLEGKKIHARFQLIYLNEGTNPGCTDLLSCLVNFRKAINWVKYISFCICSITNIFQRAFFLRSKTPVEINIIMKTSVINILPG